MLATWMLGLALALEPPTCPEGTTAHAAEDWTCMLCVDARGRPHGDAVAVEPSDGKVYRHVFDHGRWMTSESWDPEEDLRERMVGRVWSAPASEVLCGREFRVRRFRRAEDPHQRLQHGEDVGEMRIFGWKRRMYQITWWNPAGEVVSQRTGRRWPAPRAHSRGHWTDGHHGRRDHGPWVYRDDDGVVEAGQWFRGQPAGEWTRRAADGTLLERGSYVDGAASGTWTCTADDGTTRTGRYRDGWRVGAWTAVDGEDGTVTVHDYGTGGAGPRILGRHDAGGLLDAREVVDPCGPLEGWETSGDTDAG